MINGLKNRFDAAKYICYNKHWNVIRHILMLGGTDLLKYRVASKPSNYIQQMFKIMKTTAKKQTPEELKKLLEYF